MSIFSHHFDRKPCLHCNLPGRYDHHLPIIYSSLSCGYFILKGRLFIYGISRRGLEFEAGNPVRAVIGVILLLGALLVMPATAYLTGREWLQAELFA
ncbi:MAG: hypothetical protein WBG51_04805, partial [Syntrophobacteria bacterium]